jgi:hypothetical protein
MLLASKSDAKDGSFNDDPLYVKRVAYLDQLPNFKPLIKCGFLVETLASASRSKQKIAKATTEQSRPETDSEKTSLAAFESFWKAYPKKVGKGDAEKEFVKARVNGTIDALLTALEVQKRTDDWIKEGGKFIPYPAKWIKQRRWEDEPQGVAASQSRGII